MNGTSRSLHEVENLIKTFSDPTVDLLLCPPRHFAAPDVGTHHVNPDIRWRTGLPYRRIRGPYRRYFRRDAARRRRNRSHPRPLRTPDRSRGKLRNGPHQARTAQAIGLTAIICLGESLSQRESANTLDIIAGQLATSLPDNSTAENLVIAYEPIWAIGTGKIPTLAQIGEVHDFIRTRLERRFGAGVGRGTRILYGGSVKPDNAAEIFRVPNVDGALVGGASLTAADFSPPIIKRWKTRPDPPFILPEISRGGCGGGWPPPLLSSQPIPGVQ